MQLGILGLPKSGKTILFNTLTAAHHDTGKFHASKKTHVGVAAVPDPRLAKLRDLFEPERYTPATVGYVDIPGIRKGEGQESLDLAQLRTVDALLHVIRAFDDPEIPHPQGSVDPARDAATIDLELIFADHEVVERRLARLEREAKRASKSSSPTSPCRPSKRSGRCAPSSSRPTTRSGCGASSCCRRSRSWRS